MIHQMTLTPKFKDAVVYPPQECEDVQTYIHHVLTEAFATEQDKNHALQAMFNKYLFRSADGKSRADESSHLVYDPVEKTLKNIECHRQMHLQGVCKFLENMHGYSEKWDLDFRVNLV